MEQTTSSCSSAAVISSTIVRQADGSNIFWQRAHSVNPFSVSPQLPWWSHSGDAHLIAPHHNLVEQPCQRGHVQSLLSPPSLFPPPGGLVSAPSSGSGSVMAGNSSLSIHGRVSTSQFLPSSCFPTLGTVNLQAPVANAFPAAHGGQLWQGLAPPPSSSVVFVPSSRSGSAVVGHSSHSVHGHVVMSQSLPSFFFPELGTVDLQVSAATPFPAAHGAQLWQGMAPPPSGSLVAEPGSRSGSVSVGDSSLSVHGHATTSQSLPSSFSPTLGMVDLLAPASLGGQPWQGLATDLGLPACSSQGVFSGFSGQSSAALEQIVAWPRSEMPFFSPAAVSGQPLPSSNDNCVGLAQRSSNYELPPLPPSLRIPPLEEVSTYSMLSTMGGTMPRHYADSSMGAGSSIPGVPNLTAGTMKMKAPMPPLEEASMYSSMGAGTSIPGVPNLTAGAMKMKAPMPPLEEASTYSSMGTGSSIPGVPNLTAGAMKAPMPPSSQGVGAGSSNLIGFAAQPSLNSELAALRAGLQAHLLPVKQEPISNKEDGLDQDAIKHLMPDTDNSTGRGLVSWEAALKMPVESRYNGSNTNVAGSTPCHNSNSALKLSSQPLPPASLWAGASSSQSHVPGVIFTDAEKEIIRKDKSLQQLVNTDPKKAKRTLSNRMSAAKRKVIKDMRISQLECKVEMLERKRETLYAGLRLVQEKIAELGTQNKEIGMMVQELEQQAMLQDAVTENQQAQIQALNIIIKLKCREITDGSSSHMNDLHQ